MIGPVRVDGHDRVQYVGFKPAEKDGVDYQAVAFDEEHRQQHVDLAKDAGAIMQTLGRSGVRGSADFSPLPTVRPDPV